MQVPEGLHQHHRGHLGEPGPLRPLLSCRDDQLLELGVGDERLAPLLGVVPHAKPVVVHHASAPEEPGQHLLLARLRVEAHVVPELHVDNSRAAHFSSKTSPTRSVAPEFLTACSCDSCQMVSPVCSSTSRDWPVGKVNVTFPSLKL